MKVGVLVRVSPQERELWKRAADRDGISVSALVRGSVAAAIGDRQDTENRGSYVIGNASTY